MNKGLKDSIRVIHSDLQISNIRFNSAFVKAPLPLSFIDMHNASS